MCHLAISLAITRIQIAIRLNVSTRILAQILKKERTEVKN